MATQGRSHSVLQRTKRILHSLLWQTERGVPAGENAVTVFAGEGPRCVVDQLARTPEELTESLAACLLTVNHPKLVIGFDAILTLSPDHGRVYAEAGWTRERLLAEITERTMRPGADLVPRRTWNGRRRASSSRRQHAAQVPQRWTLAHICGRRCWSVLIRRCGLGKRCHR